MYDLVYRRKGQVEKFLLLSFGVITFFISRQNYLIFHTFAEMITITMGLAALTLAVATYNLSENIAFNYISIIFGFVSMIDIFHMLTYKGINIFMNDSNMPTQLWIFERYYEFIMLFICVVFSLKKIRMEKVLFTNALIIVLFLVSIIKFKAFPVCYIEGYGLTNFKIYSEYLISLGYIVLLVKLMKTEIQMSDANKSDVINALVFKVLSSLTFTLYMDVNGILNFAGHFLGLVYYYYTFRLMFKGLVVNPYSTLFEKLKNKVDELEKYNEELLEAKDKIVSTEELYKKFINFVPDGVLMIRDNKIEYANNKFLKMFGIEDKTKLENMSIYDLIHSSYHGLLMSRLEENVEAVLEAPQQYEFMWENQKKWVEVTSLIIKDESGKYLISNVRNIEDRKKAEEAQQLLELKRKEDNMKNEFFTNISHELRTPINVIYSIMQLENQYLGNMDRETINKYNKIIKQNCLRLIRLINNIIDITRIETGYFRPSMNIHNIVALVEDITLASVKFVRCKNIELVFDTDIEEAYINCDTGLINRIILNLISNSIKYGKEGGNIEVCIKQEDMNNVTICVKDDGIGIPEEVQAKIFDRFSRVDNSLSRKAEGSGIGLTLVKQLVELQLGTITFNSEIDKGTEFYITFPLSEVALELCATLEDTVDYEKNIIRFVDMEFSDIYS